MTNPLISDSRYFYARDSSEPIVYEVTSRLAREHAFGSYKKQLKHLEYLLLDLKYRYLETPNGYIHCSRDKNSYVYYQANEPYKSLNVMPTPLLSILDKLVAARLLTQDLGFQHGEGRRRVSYASRYKYTEELLKYLNQIPESAVGYERGIAQEIVLRGKKHYTDKNGKHKTRRIYYDVPANPKTASLANWVRCFNTGYAQHHIDIYRPVYPEFEQTQGEDIKESVININLNRKYLYRIFNDDLERGGRFYGAWWQSVPSELRRYIVINGNPTVEIDYRGIHIALLYAIKGIDYYAEDEYADPYTVEGWNRDDVKLLLQIVLNTSKKNVIPAFRDAMQEEGFEPYPAEDLEQLISKFEEMHAPIVEYFYEGLGVYLQNLDAKIAEGVLMNCMQVGERDEQGIIRKFPALPVHDSFIVEARHKTLLENAMTTAASEAIANMLIHDRIQIGQFTPRFKVSRILELNAIPFDSGLNIRNTLYQQCKVLPELKFLRKHNKSNSINVFKFDSSYNEIN